MIHKIRVLIVEDQKYPLEALEFAVKNVMPAAEYDIAQSFTAAEQAIEGERYDIILLDHRLPREDTGNLEMEDMSSFSDLLREIGYNLIPQIKEKCPETIIIGTSSLRSKALRNFLQPDHTMSKTWDEAEEQLQTIIND